MRKLWIQYIFISSLLVLTFGWPNSSSPSYSSIYKDEETPTLSTLSKWHPHLCLNFRPLAMLPPRSPPYILYNASPVAMWLNMSSLVCPIPDSPHRKMLGKAHLFTWGYRSWVTVFLSPIFSSHTVKYNWGGTTQSHFVAGLATTKKISVERRVGEGQAIIHSKAFFSLTIKYFKTSIKISIHRYLGGSVG